MRVGVPRTASAEAAKQGRRQVDDGVRMLVEQGALAARLTRYSTLHDREAPAYVEAALDSGVVVVALGAKPTECVTEVAITVTARRSVAGSERIDFEGVCVLNWHSLRVVVSVDRATLVGTARVALSSE